MHPRSSLSIASIAALAVLLGGCTSIPKGRSGIDDVLIEGTHAIDANDVADRMATAPTAKFAGVFRGIVYDYEVYDPSVLQRDMARIERFYRGKGFLEAHARAGRVEQIAPDHVRIDILVEEGPPTRNRGTTIDGLSALPPEIAAAVTAKADETLPPGARFDEDAYKKSKGDLKRVLTDRGYAYAMVDADASIDLAARAAHYVFKVTAGPLCTFGKITIVGLDPDGDGPRPQEIEEGPLRRAMNITEGNPYSTKDIDEATQALLDLEVFSAAQIDPELPQPPPEHPVVALKVSVEPTKLRQTRLGVGAEFDEIKTDLHILAGWEDHNFLGGLRDLSIDWQPGVVLYPLRIGDIETPKHPLLEERLKVQFRQPSFFEAHTSGFVKPEFNVYPFLVQPNPPPNTPVVGYIEGKGSIGADRPFGKLSVTVAYNAQIEHPFHYIESSPSVSPLDQALNYIQGSNQLPPEIILAYPQLVTTLDLRDDATHPHSGIYLSNDFQVASSIFGSNAHDVRIQPEARGYVPVSKRVTIAARGSLGFLFPSNYQVAKYLPNEDAGAYSPRGDGDPDRTREIEETYFRGFTSGGPSTNRGYPVRGIAPYGYVPFLLPATAASQIANGCIPGTAEASSPSCALPIAGMTLWELSIEARFEVSGPFSAAVFCDSGDVSPNVATFRLDHPHVSCGLGVRYDTPVGPIRLDLGYRINGLQVIGYLNEYDAAKHNPENGEVPQLFTNVPLAIAFGIGEAY
ncbi:MAG: outer membrane protein assembly factor [Polyangiaceae bacterium]